MMRLDSEAAATLQESWLQYCATTVSVAVLEQLEQLVKKLFGFV
jgi:hypothetical protein